ncbi:hypothetical protein A8B75_16135 [Sphingomonadales bacterium EhC05]|nr:hypothetical protein A8B75_16135 [Sphingomonadales bacterium EhC05]
MRRRDQEPSTPSALGKEHEKAETSRGTLHSSFGYLTRINISKCETMGVFQSSCRNQLRQNGM